MRSEIEIRNKISSLMAAAKKCSFDDYKRERINCQIDSLFWVILANGGGPMLDEYLEREDKLET